MNLKKSNHNDLKSNFSLTFHRFDWGSGEMGRIPPIPRCFRRPHIQYIVNCMKRGRPHNGSSKRPFLKGAKNYRVSYNLDVAPNTRTLIQKWHFNQKFKLPDNFRIAFVIQVNPNWHEGWYFYLLVIFESDFVGWFFIENFQTFLKWKLTSIGLF